jgi:hypothetical protein
MTDARVAPVLTFGAYMERHRNLWIEFCEHFGNCSTERPFCVVANTGCSMRNFYLAKVDADLNALAKWEQRNVVEESPLGIE